MQGCLRVTGILATAAAFDCVSAGLTNGGTVAKVSGSGSSTGYDYIVVGGGPSGIIAATRLAQNSNKSVFLVSRGAGPTVSTGATLTVGWNDSLTPIDVPGLSTSIASYSVGNESLENNFLCTDVQELIYAACVFGGGASFNCK